MNSSPGRIPLIEKPASTFSGNAFDRFVGIPYRDRGRGFDGCDCYGLLRLVLGELAGITLASFSDLYVSAADHHAIACLVEGLEQWDRVPEGRERRFDGVLMRTGREIRHVGVVVDPGLVLHVDRGLTSRIERYSAPPLKHRLAGFYRYRNP